MSVPIAASPGRSGFGPQLSLSYDSGSGNGPFGFGWTLSLPCITRKTDKGLPRYDDAGESDVFILSGAEDLVPALEADLTRHRGDTTAPDYIIERYRPRIEGLFARIERWTRRSDGDVHWRSISRDNVLTLYGKDAVSRIADFDDPRRIFSWLICETRDDKGNVVLYGYKGEDGEGVDLSRACERNRGQRNDPRRTINRYLKSVRYGNRTPLLDSAGHRPRFLTDLPEQQMHGAGWMFEVVLDYGEHHSDTPQPGDATPWSYRGDPFSSYRSGFEVRTTRLCQRVLMFHHIPDLPTGEKCYEGLVRSTDFNYSHEQEPLSSRNPVYTFLRAVTQSSYRRNNGGYDKRSLPAVEFEYTQPIVQETVEEVDPVSLENLPIGVDGASYQWTDLHGEGIPGILTEQAGAWYYKRNVSPISEGPVDLAPLELVALAPNLALAVGQAQFMDLAGDGQPDLVVLDGPMPGLYEHDGDESWQSFRPFTSRLNRETRDGNLKFVDLDGDGHADVLITEDDAFVWHSSEGEKGFGPALRVSQALDEEKGPRLVFADGTQSVYLADLSGDGLTDLVRIRNGEVSYWPNLGYGRFGGKVTMDQAPLYDNPDQFDQSRIRLTDIDGSGTTDILYLHRDGVRIYFNQSGNGWSEPRVLNVFPRVDDMVSITTADMLGNGTACLVWSSPLPGDAARAMRYVNLMGTGKPHLLVRTVNNLGAETTVHYAPSTKFYLRDKYDGKPWITRLPFPVHVVERVETHDRISRNRFVTRYVYHHGYFDGEERELRGFGMVEQWDTEELGALTGDGTLPAAANIDPASHVPPLQTKTWFHTGIHLGREHVSDFFEIGEYYRDPEAMLLPDTVLPAGLTPDEEREACRALKGSMLRQEVYAHDGTVKAPHPYSVTEQNFTVRREQASGGNRHSVFFTHPREAITYHYERSPADARIGHALTLDLDAFGNARKTLAIGYGRRQPDLDLPTQADRDKQTTTLITYTENDVTNAIDDPDDYRAPLPSASRTYELTGFKQSGGSVPRFSFDAWVEDDFAPLTEAVEINYDETADLGENQKRLIEHVRTLYRKNDLTGLLPPNHVESLALPGESYQLAFTPELVERIFVDSGKLTTAELDGVLAGEGRYVHGPNDTAWWIPSGRIFFSPGSTNTPAEELAHARQHFFLPRRFRDPFHTTAVSTESFVDYDVHDLLTVETRDAVGNVVTAATADDAGSTAIRIDYRVLQPSWMTDPNGNRAAVTFDTLGMVVGTAVMGKPPPAQVDGDSLEGLQADLTEAVLLDHLSNPLADPETILRRATTRLVYDLFAYQRTKNQPHPRPAAVYTLARETHDSDPVPAGGLRIQHSFSYSDGFGREIQKKIRAERGPVPLRDADGDVDPRWVGSGWTVFNNKGKPVRQYEPFFTDSHRFEFDVRVGVSAVLFYDPVERVVATLHPNHTWEKAVFDPWRQETWDVSDTVLVSDPGTDLHVGDFFQRLPDADYLPTWHTRRQGGALGTQEQSAARKAAIHAETPSVAHADSLGRSFLTVVHNKFKFSDAPAAAPPIEELHRTRVVFDIEGNQREVIDAKDRVVMRYDYDMLGTPIHQASMEAGERWMLGDVAGKPIRAWDSRGHAFRTEYDVLRRPLRSFVRGADSLHPANEVLFGKTAYGEGQPNDLQLNLRTKPFRQFDGAGVATSEAYDFKGNLLRASRRLARDYKTIPDWSANPGLEGETFTSRTSYDALSRPVQLIAPRSDQPGAKRNIIQPVYDEASMLERVHVWLDRPTEPAGLLDATTVAPSPVGVNDIDYDAKGRRLRIDYKNGATTRYAYDPETFRLIHLYTRRGATFTEDCENPAPPPATIAAPDAPPPAKSCGLQNLHYTYDPSGNITHIRDDTQQTIYFKNQRVEPSADYTYDAIYRLIDATGREHLGQLSAPPVPHSHDDAPRVGLDFAATDGKVMGTYLEKYVYDAVGNFESMQHIGVAPSNPGWTRGYVYAKPSLLEPAKPNNQLSRTAVGASNPEIYVHDAHGNMTAMPHLTLMQWDFKDQLHATARQVVINGVPETTYYVYDGAGQRVRKVTERQNETRENERTYLCGFEVYREYDGNGFIAALERETLHVMDNKQRIALVETRTDGNDGSPTPLIRYQLGNHLGSASLELDGEAQLISYEEYTPYGSTSYQAVRNAPEVSLKRYRYTGMERDEGSGLSFHLARCYAPWLARWVSPDPVGIVNGTHLYYYCRGNPIIKVDRNGMEDEYCWTPFCGEVAPGAFLKDVVFGTAEGVYDAGKGVKEGIENLAEADITLDDISKVLNEGGPGVLVIRSLIEQGKHLYEQYNLFAIAVDQGRVRSAARILSRNSVEIGIQVAVGEALGALSIEVKGLATVEGATVGRIESRAIARAEANLESRAEAAVTDVDSAMPPRSPPRSAPSEAAPVSPSVDNGRWKVGDPIDALIKGREPSWSAVRQRYWKNRNAAAGPEEFTPANVERMKKGRSPIDRYSGRPMELEHVIPQRTNAPGRHLSVMEVTPLEHAFFDAFRVGVKDIAGEVWKWSHLDSRL